MTQLYTRRDVLKTTGAAAGLSLLSILSSGCGDDSSQPVASPDPIPSNIETLEYADTDVFMKAFESHLDQGKVVKVTFSDGNKLRQTSKLFQWMKDPSRIDNYNEIVTTLKGKDTAEGRAELSHIFDSELLDHKQVSKSVTLPNGEVIDPGTVALVIVFLFAVAVASELGQKRRVRKVTLLGNTLEFEPLLDG